MATRHQLPQINSLTRSSPVRRFQSQAHIRPLQSQIPIRSREEDPRFRSFLRSGRRVGIRGHGPRSSRFLGQILYRGGQLGHGGKQHSHIFHSRSTSIPRSHPYPGKDDKDNGRDTRWIRRGIMSYGVGVVLLSLTLCCCLV